MVPTLKVQNLRICQGVPTLLTENKNIFHVALIKNGKYAITGDQGMNVSVYFNVINEFGDRKHRSPKWDLIQTIDIQKQEMVTSLEFPGDKLLIRSQTGDFWCVNTETFEVIGKFGGQNQDARRQMCFDKDTSVIFYTGGQNEIKLFQYDQQVRDQNLQLMFKPIAQNQAYSQPNQSQISKLHLISGGNKLLASHSTGINIYHFDQKTKQLSGGVNYLGHDITSFVASNYYFSDGCIESERVRCVIADYQTGLKIIDYDAKGVTSFYSIDTGLPKEEYIMLTEFPGYDWQSFPYIVARTNNKLLLIYAKGCESYVYTLLDQCLSIQKVITSTCVKYIEATGDYIIYYTLSDGYFKKIYSLVLSKHFFLGLKYHAMKRSRLDN